MEEQLIQLSKQIEKLKSKISKVSAKYNTLTLDTKNAIEGMISEKYPTINSKVNIYISSISIDIPKSESSYNITLTNRNNCSFIETPYTFNPKVSWDSGEVVKGGDCGINYLKLISYISDELISSKSKFFSYIEKEMLLISVIYKKKSKLENELYNTTIRYRNIENQLNRNKFMDSLKENNIYYYYNSRTERGMYYIYYVTKINPKTVSIIFRTSNGINDPIVEINAGRGINKRISYSELYDKLKDYNLVTDKDTFKEIIVNNKFKKGIDRVYLQNGFEHIFDINLLCEALKEKGLTTQKVPDNNTLSIISKWRNETLKKHYESIKQTV